jgi:hypothetical protein
VSGVSGDAFGLGIEAAGLGVRAGGDSRRACPAGHAIVRTWNGGLWTASRVSRTSLATLRFALCAFAGSTEERAKTSSEASGVCIRACEHGRRVLGHGLHASGSCRSDRTAAAPNLSDSRALAHAKPAISRAGRVHAQTEPGRFYSGSVLVHVEPGRVPSWVRTLAYRVRAHVFGACGEAYRACALCEASLLRRTGSPRDRLSGLLARIRSPRGRRRSQLALRRRPLTSMRRQRRRIRGPRA